MPKSWSELWPLSWIKGNVLWDGIKWLAGVCIGSIGGAHLVKETLSTAFNIALVLTGMYLMGSVIFARLAKRRGPNPSYCDAVKKSTLLAFLLSQANDIKRQLEDVDDAYAQENEKLQYPLSVKSLPATIEHHRHKMLWEFRILYLRHVAAVKSAAPEFKTKLLDPQFPKEEISYRNTLRALEDHCNGLSDEIEKLKQLSSS